MLADMGLLFYLQSQPPLGVFSAGHLPPHLDHRPPHTLGLLQVLLGLVGPARHLLLHQLPLLPRHLVLPDHLLALQHGVPVVEAELHVAGLLHLVARHVAIAFPGLVGDQPTLDSRELCQLTSSSYS